MLSKTSPVRQAFERWARQRFAFPFLVLIAAALLLVSEHTYERTTSTLKGGIELTDARIQSLRLLQLVTEAETTQLGFIATGQASYLSRYQEVNAAVPRVLDTVTTYFAKQDNSGAAGATRITVLTQRAFGQIDKVMALAEQGRQLAAEEVAQNQQTQSDVMALSKELKEQLAHAAELQQLARTSIYDALLLNRIAVGSLTLVTLLSLFSFLRQLQRQDRENDLHEAALRQDRERLESEVQRRTARLTELAQHLQTVSETERSHLARELHDELGGLLTVCKLEIARAKMKVADPTEMLLRLGRINDNLNLGIALKRRIIEDLRPSALADLGLAVALQNLCREMAASLSIPVNLSVLEFGLSPEADLAVYRFVQEALTNIGKYAQASQVDVVLAVANGRAVVTVRDDGAGFNTNDSRAGHHGLSGMQFRAESMGGSMTVSSSPGAGTTVAIEFPQVTNPALATPGQPALLAASAAVV